MSVNKKSSIEAKLSTVKYKPDSTSHLQAPGAEKCMECYERSCIYVCPAGVWSVDEEGTCVIEYENCLECGACRIACVQGLEWKHPRGGLGIIYKQS
jgi:ferredoxin like protein